MHDRVSNFLAKVKAKHPDCFNNRKVLEIGSFDMNGSPRQLFTNCPFYIGVDCVEGKGVDLVSLAHDVHFITGFFDTIISTEVLEHDLHWKKTLKNALRMLKVGGYLILTFATGNRPKHLAFATQFDGYYKNLTIDEVLKEIQTPYPNVIILEKETPGNVDAYLMVKK